MRNTLLSCVGLLLLTVGCKTIKDDELRAESSGCPEIGSCGITVRKNASLIIRTDDFGKIYPEIVASDGTDVVTFTYDNPGPKGVQDGSYREEVLFETVHTQKDFALEGKYTSGAKMIFGVFCYCKDKAGYYPVVGGKVSRKGNVYSFTLPEIVPLQKITKIEMSAEE